MSDLIERLLSLADCDSRAGEPLGKCMREAAAEIAHWKQRAETAEAALTHIKTWAEAYPVEAFTPLSNAEEAACSDALAAAVPSGCDRMHASWARHLLTGIGEVAAAALRQSESGDPRT